MEMARQDLSEEQAEVRVGSIYEQLRVDIIRGELPPDKKLKIDLLRNRYEASGSPLREALSRLSAEGLVEQVSQRGFRVSAISLEDLRELTKTRKWIDEIAIREAITHGDTAWEEGIVLAYHRLSRAPAALNSEGKNQAGWIQHHGKFHRALLAACPSRYLLNFSSLLFDSSERYRELSGDYAPNHQRDIEGEHRDIMEATLARDIDLACELMRKHIDATAESIARVLQS